MTNVTTPSNFKVEDCTYHGAREQKEILNEGAIDSTSSNGTSTPPVSLTPEQAKRYFQEQAVSTNVETARTFFNTMIRWIDELEQFRREKAKELWKDTQQKNFEGTADDI